MPFSFSKNRAVHNVKEQWRSAYRRMRLRRKAGLESRSEQEALREAGAECSSHRFRIPLLIWASSCLAICAAMAKRIFWRGR